MATPHNSANKGDISRTILLPGDPLRAQFIAEHFLKHAVCYNQVRGMYGFTGEYQGERISVMGTGMGTGSMGIYSYELIHEYDVKNLIRIGSCGAIQKGLRLGELVMAQCACTDSNYAHQYNLPGTFSAPASFELLLHAYQKADALHIPCHVGNVICSELFYTETPEWRRWADMGVLAVEMESYALYCNAARAGANALAIFSVSDSMITHEELSAEARETMFTDMMKVALETAAEQEAE
ncbi:MAG: purine-nucleoside phosphorylase, partial [Butyricicoccaceae bacterium]